MPNRKSKRASRRSNRGNARPRSGLRSVLPWLSPLSINRVTTMMLQGESTLTSSGAGVLNSFIPFDPSSAGYSFNEWTSISALYNEVKHVATEIQLVPYQYAGPGSPLYVSYRFDSAAAPGSISGVIGSATLRLFNVTRSSTNLGMRMIAHVRGPLNWSPTSTVVTSPYAGAPGCFQFYGDSYDASTPILLIRVRGIYAFRGRS